MMDAVKSIEWWLEREGPDCVPVIEIGVSSDVRSLREDMAGAADEIERLRAVLALIASFGGKCLFSYTRGPDGDQAYREGSHAAWEQAANISRAAISSGKLGT